MSNQSVTKRRAARVRTKGAKIIYNHSMMKNEIKLLEERIGFREKEIAELHEIIEKDQRTIRSLETQVSIERNHGESKAFHATRLTAELELYRQCNATLLSNSSYEIAELRTKCQTLENENRKLVNNVYSTKQGTSD